LSDKTGQTLTLHRYGTNNQMLHITTIWRCHWRCAGTSRTRDIQFTWRHNTYAHCRLRLLHHNYRWQ